MSKRRRVYALEPNKIAQTKFARKYVNHLVPALMNINKNTSLDGNGDSSETQKIVRYEVDKALVMSTPGFAWSHALKDKLQEKYINGLCLPRPRADNANLEMKVSPNPNGKARIKNLKQPSSRSVLLQPRITKKEATKQRDDEQEQIGSRLDNLRSLLPGGNEMGINDLFSEVGSYITCLELQVNILRCLVDTQ